MSNQLIERIFHNLPVLLVLWILVGARLEYDSERATRSVIRLLRIVVLWFRPRK